MCRAFFMRIYSKSGEKFSLRTRVGKPEIKLIGL
jgi:hypothetical protein